MNENHPPISKRFRNLSRLICFLCVFSAIIYLVQGFLGGLSVGLSSEAGPQINTGIGEVLRSWRERVALVPFYLSVVLTLLYGGAAFWELSKGNVFTKRSVKLLSLLALWMFVMAVSAMFSGVFLFMLRAMSSLGLENSLTIDMSTSDFVTLGLSGMVYSFALILREAKRHVDDVRLIF
ncbi:MAG: hypothetical protein ABJ275_08315 [Maricaulaceae bacterium]